MKKENIINVLCITGSVCAMVYCIYNIHKKEKAIDKDYINLSAKTDRKYHLETGIINGACIGAASCILINKILNILHK